jgi:hypothetical protein
LISWKFEIHGSGGIMIGRAPVTVNGTRPTYAFPSNVSMVSPGGTSACSSMTGTSQWRKSRWCQFWCMSTCWSGSRVGVTRSIAS